MKNQLVPIGFLFSLLLSISSSIAAANEDDEARQLLSDIFENNENAERCLNLNRIDHTDILDDQTILFYMRDKRVFVNHLPHRCSGLRSADTYMYRTSLNKLCNVDIITVLNNIGIGFQPGISCGLGLFIPIDRDMAKYLKTKLK